MKKTVTQLFPVPGAEVSLNGLYLKHQLHLKGSPAKPCVYANFISSLDGRIGIPKAGSNSHQVPPNIANKRDWRLFQELAAQADILLTSARYFRQLNSGEAQDFLPIGKETEYEDLHEWRINQGLPPQPAIAILSASLDIPLQTLDIYRERSVYIITGEAADPQRIRELEAQGIPVLIAGNGKQVEGEQLIKCLGKKGFKSIYAIAGPRVMHTLVSAQMLDYLYLTLAHRIIGGKEFDTFAWGESINPGADLSLQHLYYDPDGLDGTGQWMSVFSA